jgi:hypothetical protein
MRQDQFAFRGTRYKFFGQLHTNLFGFGILIAVVLAMGSNLFAADANDIRVAGAGKTIIEGGTGGPSPIPVVTTVAFHANAKGGDFECLALAPPNATGPQSGQFTVNVMYVTGSVTSFSIDADHRSAELHGTATITGIGAGQNVPFTAQVREGGSGTTIILTVFPPQQKELVFHEILLEGEISIR